MRSPAPAPSAEPELAPLLSDDRKNALLVAINELIGKTEANLRVAEGHSLSDAQRELIKDVRTFLAQGQEARSRDLAAAKSLSQRAEILSRELLSQLK